MTTQQTYELCDLLRRLDAPENDATAREALHYSENATAQTPPDSDQTASAPAVDLPQLVRAFCEGQKWAVQAWKDQPHIKPLFDFANDQADL